MGWVERLAKRSANHFDDPASQANDVRARDNRYSSTASASESTGLLGAALDNLGNAAGYVVSLYAVGRTVVAKAQAARLSGVLLIVTALMLLGEIIRRFVAGFEATGMAM